MLKRVMDVTYPILATRNSDSTNIHFNYMLTNIKERKSKLAAAVGKQPIILNLVASGRLNYGTTDVVDTPSNHSIETCFYFLFSLQTFHTYQELNRISRNRPMEFFI